MRIDGQGLGLMYGSEEKTMCLKDASISLKPGEMTVIQGPSGSGKSSLLYLLSGLRKPTSGTVYINDVDLESYTVNEKDLLRKQKFGFVFQRLFLLHYLTSLENVMVGMHDVRPSSAQYAMSLLTKLGIVMWQPKTLYLSGASVSESLSPRALANTPEWSLLMSQQIVGYDNAIDVMNILNDCKVHASILVVTHDNSILEKADRVMQLHDGVLHP